MRALRSLALFAVLALAHDAAADPVEAAPVVVTHSGPKAIKIRLSVGSAQPCDSSANRMIYTGPIKPGEVLDAPFTEPCACLEQTYDDFPEVGWSAPILRCRPKVCTGSWGVPDVTVPIYFSIQSKRPAGS